ncbi:hypothetical protein B0A49_03397 [Cryomyces minteri]|uniref:Uncharacterized protein n=1 Tax=Cryomyces minteri TaxID=331657 RepID=A0A4U0XKR4_9PEZI|nr:hypothetical protein B0A49_03397 [Cryomyces minteri]
MAVPTRAEIEAFDVHLRAHFPHVLAASNRLQFAMCLDEDTLSGLCTKMPPSREAPVLVRHCRNRMTASRLRLGPESGEGGAATPDSTPNDDGGSGGVKIEEGDEGAESKREEEPADLLYRKPTDSTPSDLLVIVHPATNPPLANSNATTTSTLPMSWARTTSPSSQLSIPTPGPARTSPLAPKPSLWQRESDTSASLPSSSPLKTSKRLKTENDGTSCLMPPPHRRPHRPRHVQRR